MLDQAGFRRFVEGHRARHQFAKLPEFDAGAAMYATWLKVLRARGVTEAEALEEASARLLIEPPRTHLMHFPTLCTFAEEAMRRFGKATPAKADISTREGAEAASRGCERCDGIGLATVWHPDPDPAGRIPGTVAAYCVCALGRWIEKNHAKRAPDVRKRMVDLTDVLAGRSVWKAQRVERPANRTVNEDAPS